MATKEQALTVRTAHSELACLYRPEQPRPEDTRAAPGTLEARAGVLVLVHASPTGHKNCAPLQQLAKLLKCATLRFDLTGCGESTGEARVGSHQRDAADVRAVVQHAREQLGHHVLGLVGFAEGGTAVLTYVAEWRDVQNVITLSARAVQSTWFERCLTWAQLQQLNSEGSVEWPLPAPKFGRSKLVVTQADVKAPLELSSLSACSGTHFLALHGSQDATVPLADAHALEALLHGSASHELRVIPGVGHEWEGREETLAYAVGEWLWRRTRVVGADGPTSGGGDGRPQLEQRPSGFNIFVDDLRGQVREIHAAARLNLPSMADANEDDDDDDDEPIAASSAAAKTESS